jgi:hypothetical protein
MTYTYQLLDANTPGSLSEVVNDALAKGWELWGSPFWGHSYCQAVVKWEEKIHDTIEEMTSGDVIQFERGPGGYDPETSHFQFGCRYE